MFRTNKWLGCKNLQEQVIKLLDRKVVTTMAKLNGKIIWVFLYFHMKFNSDFQHDFATKSKQIDQFYKISSRNYKILQK